MRKGVVTKLCIAAAISAILLWLLLRQIQLKDVQATFDQLPLGLIFASVFLYLGLHICRAIRLALFVPGKPWSLALAITVLHNLSVSLLPFRLGELSLPYLYRRHRIPLRRSIAALALTRMFDTLGICLYFIIGVWMIADILPAGIHQAARLAAIFGAILVMAIIAIVRYAEGAMQYLHSRHQRLNSVLSKLQSFLRELTVLRRQHILMKVTALSLASWGFQFLWSWLVFRELLDANFWAIVVGTTLPMVSTAIPIQGVASLGTFEGVWMLVFVAFGVSQDIAIASGLIYHVLNIGYAVILGILGAALYFSPKNTKLPR